MGRNREYGKRDGFIAVVLWKEHRIQKESFTTEKNLKKKNKLHLLYLWSYFFLTKIFVINEMKGKAYVEKST